MFNDRKTLLDPGTFNVAFGMNAATDPRDLPEQQFAGGINVVTRKGILKPRPGFRCLLNSDPFGVDASQIVDTGAVMPQYNYNDSTGDCTINLVPNKYCFSFSKGAIQGAAPYVWGDEVYGWVVISGFIYRLTVTANWYALEKQTMMDGTQGPYLDESAPIYICQASQYVVFQDGIGNPVVFNGMGLRYADNSVSGMPEVPIGKAMCFNNGRLWVANGKNVYAGDILGRADSTVITFSENLYMSGGSSFQFPENVVGLAGAPKLDSATGFGELVVGCENSMHSINAEITDRLQWGSSSMQHVLYANVGCSSHFSMTNVATDLYWRYKDSIHSFRNSNLAINPYYINLLVSSMRPASVEIDSFLTGDREDLLESAHGMFVNGRLLNTCYHAVTEYNGVSAYGMVSLDFNTSLIGTQNGGTTSPQTPVWDGAWSGVCPSAFLQLTIANTQRSFMLCTDADGENRIWEVSKEDAYDNQIYSRKPVRWRVDTRSYNCGTPAEFKKFISVSTGLKDVQGQVGLGVSFRSDGDTCWSPLGQLSYFARDTQIATAGSPWVEWQPHHLPDVRPPTPPDNVGIDSKRPAWSGRAFQLKYEGYGKMSLYRIMVLAERMADLPGGSLFMTAPPAQNNNNNISQS